MLQANNVTMLTGRLTKDPEIRYTSTENKAVGGFTIAVDKYISKDKKETSFIPIVVWDKLAEWARDYIFQGKKIIVLGYLRTRTWDDDKGVRHYVTEVVAESMDFADDKKKDGQPQAQQQAAPQQQNPPAEQKTHIHPSYQPQAWTQQNNQSAAQQPNDNPWMQQQIPQSFQTSPAGAVTHQGTGGAPANTQVDTSGKPPWM
jgi:single-strand DNA-binding protein